MLFRSYPGKYNTGYEISEVGKLEGKLFLAGATGDNGLLKTNGGRVLGITGFGGTLEKAREIAYTDMKKVQFDGMYFRKDIGK